MKPLIERGPVARRLLLNAFELATAAAIASVLWLIFRHAITGRDAWAVCFVFALAYGRFSELIASLHEIAIHQKRFTQRYLEMNETQ